MHKTLELTQLRNFTLALQINLPASLGLIKELKYFNGNLHYRLNFDPDKTNKIFYHGLKEHVKISRTAKFGCEML